LPVATSITEVDTKMSFTDSNSETAASLPVENSMSNMLAPVEVVTEAADAEIDSGLGANVPDALETSAVVDAPVAALAPDVRIVAAVTAKPATATRPAESTGVNAEENGFRQLKLIAPLMKAIEDSGYTTPTPIQAQTIAHLLEGRDVLGMAQTGSGKTGRFRIADAAADRSRCSPPAGSGPGADA
jgi:superfamily II RNA helicase